MSTYNRRYIDYDKLCQTFGKKRPLTAFKDKLEVAHWQGYKEAEIIASNEKQYFDLIDPHEDDFGAILICAIRYSLGRRTYMPSLVCGFAKPYLKYLSNNDLYVFERDIKDCYDYGDDCDKKVWMNFLDAVQHERASRGDTNK